MMKKIASGSDVVTDGTPDGRPDSAPNASVSHSLAEIGAGLRAHRQRQQLTLAEVAAKSDLSESALSRIERGQIGVSVMKLAQICDVLSIAINELFHAEKPVRRTSVVTHGNLNGRDTAAGTGYLWKHLAGGAPLDQLDVFHLIMPKEDTMRTLVSHAGQEYCFVLEGVVDFFVGDERIRLATGEGIFLDSELPHRAERVGDASAHLLMLVAGRNRAAAADWFNLARPGREPVASLVRERSGRS